jgi:trehalose-6-phosphatase
MTTGNIEFLRTLRAWHYQQAVDLRGQAQAIESRRSRNDSAVAANERVANVFHKRSNEHLRFVQQLNDFFPVTDRVM